MYIDEEILTTFFQCRLKSFHLLNNRRRNKPHALLLEIEKRKKSSIKQYGNLFPNLLENDSLIDDESNICSENLTSKIEGIIRRKGKSKDRDHYILEPIHFSGKNNASKEDKINIAFKGYIISKLTDSPPDYGSIIQYNGKVKRVKLTRLYKSIEEAILIIKSWKDTGINKPLLILNKHCELCCFKELCSKEAKSKEDLSLLSRINNEKVLKGFHKKGIFNIKQLSFLYRPRRRNKKKKSPLKHSFELQALAIERGKIFINEEPDIKRNRTEIYLDIETTPDEEFCYLIGFIVKEEGNTDKYFYFWADSVEDEKEILLNFINQVSQYNTSPIYHYGNYDLSILKKMADRFDLTIDHILRRFINVNSFIFGKIYFPIYSNSLKEIAHYLSVENPSDIRSGLESIAFRYKWERTNKLTLQKSIVKYNEFDCRCVMKLVNSLIEFTDEVNTQQSVTLISQPRKNSTEIGMVLHNQIDVILKMGHETYDKRKIKFKNANVKTNSSKIGAKFGHKGKTRKRRKAKREIVLPRVAHCHKDGTRLIYRNKTKTIVVTDLVFTKNGIRKTDIGYTYEGGYCKKCKKIILSEEAKKMRNRHFGHNFKSWIVYQRVFLRLPHDLIRRFTNIQFNETISSGSITNFMKSCAIFYVETELLLEKEIKKSRFIHADETKVNIRGIDHYVWTFTDGKNVIFKLTETREAGIVCEFLKDFNGILISDFYAAYDSVKCKKQKCWVHLLRDINDDLWKHPFDSEFEYFVTELRNLIVPIFETVQRYGLKKYHFNKHKIRIDKFYKRDINNKIYRSELCLKYQKRLRKFKGSLFTFIYEDGIPWNNNASERALRHLAVQRKISGFFFKKGIQDYLILLGIMQSCRFQNKCFLKFMLSGLKDLSKFNGKKKTTLNNA